MYYRVFTVFIAFLMFTSCTSSTDVKPTVNNEGLSGVPVKPTMLASTDAFADLPEEARIATRVGDPRPVAYWALWNTCAPDNRAETAKTNGGRAAGWFLMDDLITEPGIQLGDYPIITCEAGLSVLKGSNASGNEASTGILNLAAALLAADLNLNVGTESCPIAEEAVIGGHLVLSEVGFDGSDINSVVSSEVANAVPRLLELLKGYNRGELCR